MSKKKVNASTLKKLYAMKEKDLIVTIGEINGENVDVTIKNFLSSKNFFEFADRMKQVEFSGNNVYNPASGQILFNLLLVQYYTDIDLPPDLETAYDYVMALGINDKILEHIRNTEQYFELQKVLDLQRKYNMAQNSGVLKLFSDFLNIVAKTDSETLLAVLDSKGSETNADI